METARARILRHSTAADGAVEAMMAAGGVIGTTELDASVWTKVGPPEARRFEHLDGGVLQIEIEPEEAEGPTVGATTRAFQEVAGALETASGKIGELQARLQEKSPNRRDHEDLRAGHQLLTMASRLAVETRNAVRAAGMVTNLVADAWDNDDEI